MGKHAAKNEAGIDNLSENSDFTLDPKNKGKNILVIRISIFLVVALIAIATAYFIKTQVAINKTNNPTPKQTLTKNEIMKYYNEGKYTLIIPSLKTYVDSNENDKKMRDLLASAYLLTGQKKAALDEYLALLKIYPNDAEILYKTGVLLESVGRKREAITYLSGAVRTSPNTVLFRIELARANAREKLYNNAKQEWQAVLNLLPPNDKTRVVALAELANIYILETNYPQAKAAINAGLQLDPENALLKELNSKISNQQMTTDTASQTGVSNSVP